MGSLKEKRLYLGRITFGKIVNNLREDGEAVGASVVDDSRDHCDLAEELTTSSKSMYNFIRYNFFCTISM